MTDIDKVIEEARAAVLPYESWERLPGESGAAFAAFCVYRDFGAERNIRKAVEGYIRKADIPTEFSPEAKTPHLETLIAKRYRVWREWSMQFKWRERAEDYDLYLDRLKQAELRKTIEEQGKVHRMVTGKMLQVVSKKLDLMEPGDLTQGAVTDWVSAAIRAEREAGQFADANCLGVSTSRNSTPKDGQITFFQEFEGL